MGTLLIVLLVLAPAGFRAAPISAEPQLQLPRPTDGPGVGQIKRSLQRKIDRAWRELAAGDMDACRRRASRIRPDAAAVDLLRLQLDLVSATSEVGDRLAKLCREHSDYAACWATLSIVAERAGDEALALEAAERTASLWPGSSWAELEADFRQRWIDDRIAAAHDLAENGASDEALAELDTALALDPTRASAKIPLARIFIKNDELERADELLGSMGDDAQARFLRGEIAESRGRWQAAMEFYAGLPVDFPHREAAMKRARTRWRLSLLPAYARAAMSSSELTRGELAVVLVSSQPRLKTLPGGTVPVMSDIVDDPGQREIITVVRLGIMHADRRGHVFAPDAVVDEATVVFAVDRARLLLGLDPCTWCTDTAVVGSGCHSIPNPPDGDTVFRAMLESTNGAKQ